MLYQPKLLFLILLIVIGFYQCTTFAKEIPRQTNRLIKLNNKAQNFLKGKVYDITLSATSMPTTVDTKIGTVLISATRII